MIESYGNVYKAEILLVPPGGIERDKARFNALFSLMSLSMNRQEQGLPYLTWVASDADFGHLSSDYVSITPGVQLSTQTHPEFHKEMDHDQFVHLVQQYAEYLAKEQGVAMIYVNYLGMHKLAIYKVDPNYEGRTTA